MTTGGGSLEESKGPCGRIPKELYEEDQKVKQKEVDKVDEAIRRGKLEEKAGDNRYIPQGIKIWAGKESDFHER